MLKTILLACAAMAVATTASAAVFDFSAAPHQNNLGATETYTVAGLTIVASGFNQFGSATDLFGKHGSGDEKGLGMTNDPSHENEIFFGKGFVQLDLSGLIGKVLANSLQFGTNSTTGGEAWAVYGTNTAGSKTGGAVVASGSNEGLHSLSGLGTYRYFDFYETSQSGGKNFLITSLSATAVPEPTSWTMMIVGFGGLGAMIRRRRSILGSIAA